MSLFAEPPHPQWEIIVIMVHVVRFVPVHLARLRYQFAALECPLCYASRPVLFGMPASHLCGISATIPGDSAQPVRVILAKFPTIRAEPFFRIPQPLDVASADMARCAALATLDLDYWPRHF